MYAPPVRTSSAGARSIFPLAAICCLGILGFLIAATIVLALIPIYLPTKQAVASSSSANNTFYLQYTANASSINNSLTGTIVNLNALSSALNLGSGATLQGGQTQATFQRRRRSLGNRRQKRTLLTNFLLACTPNFRADCISPSCRTGIITKVQTAIQTAGSLSNFPCQIHSKGVVSTFTYTLTFVSILTTRPIGFVGEVSSFIFYATKSGAFNDPTVWAGGVVPYGDFSVVITVGITVTLSRSLFELSMHTCDVYGSLSLGLGSSSFTFTYGPNIIVRSGGVLQDQTSNKKIYLPAGSLVTLHPGGSCSSSTTVLQAYTSLPAASNTGSSVPLPTSGPFTCGILPTGTLVSFNKVTFIAVQSGGFTSGSTYLGGIAPTADLCSLVGGIGIYVSPGVTLSTFDLNGLLSMKVDIITVAVGGKLELGTPGSSAGFKFTYPVELDIFGILSFVASGGGIFVVGGSALNLFAGGSFISGISTFLQVYDAATGLIIGTALSLGTSLSGPYFITISSGGTISISVTGPGGVTIVIGSTIASVTAVIS